MNTLKADNSLIVEVVQLFLDLARVPTLPYTLSTRTNQPDACPPTQLHELEQQDFWAGRQDPNFFLREIFEFHPSVQRPVELVHWELRRGHAQPTNQLHDLTVYVAWPRRPRQADHISL